jgi:hypothetical protein
MTPSVRPTISTTTWIREEHFEGASEFIAALSPQSDRWGERPDWWIFRGQANASWTLDPVIFRDDPGFEIGGPEPVRARERHEDQIKLEGQLVRLFVLGVDEQGSDLPNEASFGIAEWLELDKRILESTSRSGIWPPAELQPLFALAQHYGVPTRLLDWSLQGKVAAYFAAASARRRELAGRKPPESLAVWAYNASRAQESGLWEGAETWPAVVRVPRFQNPNLNAQGGVFTLVANERMGARDAARMPALDRLIAERAGRLGLEAKLGPVLYRLSLPLAQAGEALRRLRYERISATHLFPGYDGVVEGIRERALWDEVTFPWDY